MFKRFKRWWRIHWLKGRARGFAIRYDRLKDNYDCGNSLAEYMNPKLAWLRMKYEKAIAELKLIDPNFNK